MYLMAHCQKAQHGAVTSMDTTENKNKLTIEQNLHRLYCKFTMIGKLVQLTM
jgi:RNase P subunit RPR2